MTQTSIERIGLTADELENVTASEEDRRSMYAITPIEGRYEKYVHDFHFLTSGFEWNKRRVWIEIEYLISLAEFLTDSKTQKTKIIDRKFTEKEKSIMRGLYMNFSEKDFLQMKAIEKKTNHDLVAAVRWIDYKLSAANIFVEGAIHFGRTSADIDTNVYNSIVRDLIWKEYLPSVIAIQKQLIENSKKWGFVFAGQTHGQWAEYTTLKKIFANFVDGIRQGLEGFYENNQKIRSIGKLGGAIGNNSDIYGAYPDLDWETFNKNFIENVLDLEYFPMADQDSFNIRNNELFDSITRINDVLIKLSEDFWEYCSRGVLVKKPAATESGSSVMAQKANPWRIEGGWEYLADVNFTKYHNLTMYKRQGDLRRSIRARTIGEPFAKCVIGISRILEELNLYIPNRELIDTENNENIAMSSAYIQTILRREGNNDAYDQLKKVSMGRQVSENEYSDMLDNMVKEEQITSEVAKEIKNGMKPANNIGLANVLADQAIDIAEKQLKLLSVLTKE